MAALNWKAYSTTAVQFLIPAHFLGSGSLKFRSWNPIYSLEHVQWNIISSSLDFSCITKVLQQVYYQKGMSQNIQLSCNITVWICAHLSTMSNSMFCTRHVRYNVCEGFGQHAEVIAYISFPIFKSPYVSLFLASFNNFSLIIINCYY